MGTGSFFALLPFAKKVPVPIFGCHPQAGSFPLGGAERELAEQGVLSDLEQNRDHQGWILL